MSYLLKCIIIGDSGAGKTALMQRFVKGVFGSAIEPTIGVEFGTAHLDISNKNVKLQIWDTAGHEHFRCVTRAYYRGAACVLIVFDVGSVESFKSVGTWLNEIETETPDAQRILVGNKVDKEGRQVLSEEANDFARTNQLLYVETSSLTGENVREAFICCADAFMQRLENGDVEDTVLRSRAIDDPGSESGGYCRSIAYNTKQRGKTQCCT